VADAMTPLSRARWLVSDPSHAGWTTHRSILAALRDGKAEQAAGLVEAHLRQTRERLLAAFQKGRRSLRARGVVVA
jgi:DNA-binding GntR family transcriptional regulator